MNFSIEHLGLPARDPIALKDWYVSKLDGKLIFADGKTPPAFFVQMPGGVVLEIYQAEKSIEDTRNNNVSGWRHVALRVDSIEDSKTLLEKRGVTFTKPINPAGGVGRVLYFEDAEGNLLHLVDRPPDSPIARADRA